LREGLKRKISYHLEYHLENFLFFYVFMMLVFVLLGVGIVYFGTNGGLFVALVLFLIILLIGWLYRRVVEKEAEKLDKSLVWRRFRKKPVVVRAARLPISATVCTLEGPMYGEAGDWLIEGVKGELYVCRDEVFRRTYEPVERRDGDEQDKDRVD